MTIITEAQFADFPNVAGRTTFSYAELLAQLTKDIPSGGSPFIGQGCAVQRAPSVSVPNGFPGLDLTFTGAPNPFYDDLGFFNPAAPTLLTIPITSPAIKRVMLIGQLVWSSSTTTDFEGFVNMGGGIFIEGHASVPASATPPSVAQYLNFTVPPTDVVAGDTFTLRAIQFSSPAASQTLARGQLTIIVMQ